MISISIDLAVIEVTPALQLNTKHVALRFGLVLIDILDAHLTLTKCERFHAGEH